MICYQTTLTEESVTVAEAKENVLQLRDSDSAQGKKNPNKDKVRNQSASKSKSANSRSGMGWLIVSLDKGKSLTVFSFTFNQLFGLC